MSTHMSDFINEQDPFCDYFSECSCGLNSIHACCHAPCHVGNGLDSETESLPLSSFCKKLPWSWCSLYEIEQLQRYKGRGFTSVSSTFVFLSTNIWSSLYHTGIRINTCEEKISTYKSTPSNNHKRDPVHLWNHSGEYALHSS